MAEVLELGMDRPDECPGCGGAMRVVTGMGRIRGQGCRPVRLKCCASLLCGHPQARKIRLHYGEPQDQDELARILTEWKDRTP